MRRSEALRVLAAVSAVAVCCAIPSATVAAQDFCFQAAVNYTAGDSPHSVFAADLDGDHDADLAVANQYRNNISVLKNNGDGTFAVAMNYAAGDYSASVFAADLDGDGDQDLVVVSDQTWGYPYDGTVSVLKNNGDGTFATPVNYAAGKRPYSVFAADLDGDGDQDLAVADPEGGVWILKNHGDGTFAAAVNYAAGDGPYSVFAADLDGDNDADLAVANGDGVSVLKNNGDGTFAAAVNYAAGDYPSSIFVADLDGDGDADLAVATQNSDNVSVLKNNGDGTFAAAVNYADGDAPQSVFAADLDGDHAADLAVANAGSDNVSVLKNNGDGTFAAAVNYATGDWSASVFAADLDGDGDQDLAVANWYSGNVSVLINCTERQSGALQVTLFPQDVVATGRWRRVGTTAWLPSDYTETGVPVGVFTVEFLPVIGWITPANQPVAITNGQLTTAAGTYAARPPYRFVHLTDIHMGAHGAAENLHEAILYIKAMTPQPAFVVFSGDLADRVLPEFPSYRSYLDFVDSVSRLQPITTYFCPGNHDHRWGIGDYQTYVYHDLDFYTFPHGTDVKLISMNSGANPTGIPLACLSSPVSNGMAPDQMDSLNSVLRGPAPGLHKVLFMHHPIVWCSGSYCGSEPICGDACISSYRDSLWDMLRDPNGDGNGEDAVEVFLCGHTHSDEHAQYQTDQSPLNAPIQLFQGSRWLSTGDYAGRLPLQIITPSASEECALRVLEVDGSVVRVGPVEYFKSVAKVRITSIAHVAKTSQSRSGSADAVGPGARLHVYDSQGRHVGINTLGDVDYEIPGVYYAVIADYDSASGTQTIAGEVVTVPLGTEQYTFRFVPTDSCEANVDVFLNNTQLNVSYSQIVARAVGGGALLLYQDSLDPIIYWDDNGDSIPDRQIPPDCYCPCRADPQCDHATNLQDVVLTVNVAFRGAAPVFDPNCPRERTDVNCDGYSTVQDVVKVVNVAFRGADPATEFCNPCP